jgi:ribonucleoside-diphosphate reductase beta chain
MLSWDDYEDAPAPAPLSSVAPARRLIAEASHDPAPAAPLATTPVPAPAGPAVAPMAAVLDEPITVAELSVTLVATRQEVMHQAEAALAELHAPLHGDGRAEEYQRVTVDRKRMINCRADLNQLVPFKYDWA